MPKALSLFLPNVLIDLTRRQLRLRETGSAVPTRANRSTAVESAPILIVETIGSKQSVVACCSRCTHAGISPGMSFAHAQALLPSENAHIAKHHPERAGRALYRLAIWLATFAPIVASDPPDGLMMDIAGCEHLFGGDEHHARRIGRAVWKLGLRCRIAVAPTFALAWAHARFSPRLFTMIGPTEIASAMKSLPIAALRVEPSITAGLQEVGVRVIGDLLNLHRESLAPRFGPELALRLDQALGHAIEHIEPVRPKPPLRAERVFDGGTTRLETLHLAFSDMLEEITQKLRTRGTGARLLLAEFSRVGSPRVTFTLTLSRPSRSVKHLRGLLSRKIDKVNMGFGVEAVSLTAARTGRMRATQHTAWGACSDAESGDQYAELIDTLSDRLGQNAVLSLQPVGTHIPEHAFHAIPALAAVHRIPPVLPDASAAPHERPTLMLSPPEPAIALAFVHDGPPMRLAWRDQTHAIIAAAGPERIAPQWWSGDGHIRDYYRIQLEAGQWLWVFRELDTARWMVHGIWA